MNQTMILFFLSIIAIAALYVVALAVPVQLLALVFAGNIVRVFWERVPDFLNHVLTVN